MALLLEQYHRNDKTTLLSDGHWRWVYFLLGSCINWGLVRLKRRALMFLSGEESEDERRYLLALGDLLRQCNWQLDTMGAQAEVKEGEGQSTPGEARVFYQRLLERISLACVFPWQLFLGTLTKSYYFVFCSSSLTAFLYCFLFPLTTWRRLVFQAYLPSTNIEREKYFWITRKVLDLRDLVGFWRCSEIITPTAHTAQVLAQRFRLSSESVRVLPPSYREFMGYSFTVDPEQKKKSQEVRGALTSLYRLPEDALIICAAEVPDGDNSLIALVRAVAAIGDDRLCLFLFGERLRNSEFLAVASGLGLSERVNIIDSEQQRLEVLKGAHLFVFLGQQALNFSAIFSAMEAGVPVISFNHPEAAEVLRRAELKVEQQSVEILRQRLSYIFDSKANYRKITEIFNGLAQELDFDWKARASEVLGIHEQQS